MIVGTSITKIDGNPYYSPSFPRGGLSAAITVDVTNISSGAGLDVTLEGRNADETTWTVMATFTTLSSIGMSTKEFSEPREQLRFKFEFTAGSGNTDSVHFNVLPPAWQPY